MAKKYVNIEIDVEHEYSVHIYWFNLTFGDLANEWSWIESSFFFQFYHSFKAFDYFCDDWHCVVTFEICQK